MRDMFRYFLQSCTREEAIEVHDALDDLLHGRLSKRDIALKTCPWCSSTHVVRKGHDRDGGQRWLCTSCGRTFNMRTICSRDADDLSGTATPAPARA